MRLKAFLRKYIVYVVIGIIIILLLVLALIIILRDRDSVPLDPITGRPIPSSALPVVEQPLSYHKNYRISFSPVVIEELGGLEKNLYPSFEIKNVDHLTWVEKFVNDIDGFNFEYSKSSPVPEFVHHYWKDGENSVSYNFGRDTLFFTFSSGVSLPGINIDPSDITNVEKNLATLSKNYFSSDFEYLISDISREGNDYRVTFSRVLLNYPVHVDMQKEYLIVTPDGRLKSGFFLLAEFSERNGMAYPLISSADLVSKISTLEYPKDVKFFNLDAGIEEEFAPYGYVVYSNPFLQEGSINVESFDLIYLYSDRNQEISVITFLFSGDGTLDVEGESSSADFTVLANALSPEFVYVPPASFFDQLQEAN